MAVIIALHHIATIVVAAFLFSSFKYRMVGTNGLVAKGPVLVVTIIKSSLEVAWTLVKPIGPP